MKSKAMAHVKHADVLVTACLHQTDEGRVAVLATQVNEDLAPLELMGIGEGLMVLAERLIQQAEAQARAS